MIILKLLSLFARLMPLSTALKCGQVLGLLFYYLFPSRRRITLDNLRQAFSSKPYALSSKLTHIAKSMARHMGQNAIEFLRLPSLTKDNMDAYIKWSGLEHLDNALKLQ